MEHKKFEELSATDIYEINYRIHALWDLTPLNKEDYKAFLKHIRHINKNIKIPKEIRK